MVIVALVMVSLVAFLLPMYSKFKNGEGLITREGYVLLIRDVLGIAACMAGFLAMGARAVFRNLKHLKDEPQDKT
jgi:glycerol-3-phosphate acyltransferase PlsY